MILECPNCDTRYEIPVELPPQGRKVRCASCQHIWVAMPGDTDAEPEMATPSLETEETAQETAEDKTPQDTLGDALAAEKTAGEAPKPDLSALDEFTDEEIVFKDEEPNEGAVEEETADANPDMVAEPAGDEMFSDTEMEDAFSAAVAEAGMASQEDELEAEAEPEPEPEPEPESPPIVIGKAKRKRRGSLPANLAAGWAALAVALAGVLSLGYFQRVNVVRLFPGAAAAYERIGLPVNIRGLEFEGVKYSWETSAGRPVLEVFGDIVNITGRPLKVPTVVFGLRTKERVEVYQWAADVRSDPLPPGERTAFAAQIPSPPKSIRDVQVRFAKVR